MVDRYYNPFQAIDINVPVEFHEAFSRYCQRTSGAVIDNSPFPRMVDLWFLSVCLAARLRLEPADKIESGTKKIIDGSIFGTEPWRIHMLMLIAIDQADDIHVVSDPRKMMSIASSLAIAGLPMVLDMLKDGNADPIWNLSDSVDSILYKENPLGS